MARHSNKQLLNSLILIIFSVCFHSCMPVMQLAYGLHQPKYVSDEAVIKYYNRLGMDDEIYRVKDYSEENRNQYRYLGNSMPEVLLFNSRGQLTKFEPTCSGRLDSIVQLSTYDIDNNDSIVEATSLRDFINDSYVINAGNNQDIILHPMPVYV